MKITISCLTGKKITVEVESFNTIEELKKKVEEKEKIPVNLQKLVFAGQIIEDYFTLEHYNIQKDTTLYMVSWSRYYVQGIEFNHSNYYMDPKVNVITVGSLLKDWGDYKSILKNEKLVGINNLQKKISSIELDNCELSGIRFQDFVLKCDNLKRLSIVGNTPDMFYTNIGDLKSSRSNLVELKVVESNGNGLDRVFSEIEFPMMERLVVSLKRNEHFIGKNWKDLPRLKHLWISNCNKFEDEFFINQSCVTKLESLVLKFALYLGRFINKWKKLDSLRLVELEVCVAINDNFFRFMNLKNLESLTLNKMKNVTGNRWKCNFKNLIDLKIKGFNHQFGDGIFQGMNNLKRLERIDIFGGRMLKGERWNKKLMPMLKKIKINGCHSFVNKALEKLFWGKKNRMIEKKHFLSRIQKIFLKRLHGHCKSHNFCDVFVVTKKM